MWMQMEKAISVPEEFGAIEAEPLASLRDHPTRRGKGGFCPILYKRAKQKGTRKEAMRVGLESDPGGGFLQRWGPDMSDSCHNRRTRSAWRDTPSFL